MTGADVRRGYGPVTELDREGLAWAAGVFDGEGHVRSSLNGQGYRSVRLIIGQAHPELLERFTRIVGVGRVLGPRSYKSRRGCSPMWVLEVGARDLVHRICWMLWPWLGSVKRRQFHEAFEKYHALG